MPFLLSWTTWIFGGLTVLLLAALLLSAWMLAEYFSLKGNFPVEESLIGQIGTVKKETTPHQRGKVYVAGAYWDAISDYGSLHEGEDIEVVEVKEKFLVVRKVDLVSGGA
jgi:membrane protein implicated in regulation of membrane protease activity